MSGKVSARLSGQSVQWMAGCTNNMDAAAVSALPPREKLGWGCNLDVKWGASFPSQTSSVLPEGLVPVVC